MKKTDINRIRGIVPPIVTPFTADDSIDTDALRRVIRHVAAAGVHGIFVAGTSGEAYALTDDEVATLTEVALEEVGDRLPVYAGTGAVTTRQAIERTVRATRMGAHAISLITPYFISPTEEELYAHFAAIAESTSLPILLYSNPARTGVRISLPVICRLAQAFPHVVGIKESGGDMTHMLRILRDTPPGFRLFSGMDTLIFSSLVSGASGAIAASANVVPKLVVEIYESVQAGNLARAQELQASLIPFRTAFTLGTFPVIIKEALNLIGMEVGYARAPVGKLTADAREQLRSLLAGLGAL